MMEQKEETDKSIIIDGDVNTPLSKKDRSTGRLYVGASVTSLRGHSLGLTGGTSVVLGGPLRCPDR